MSWFSDRTGIHWGNIGAPVGAAIGSIIPGVGTAIGAGLGQALGGLGSGQNIGQAVKGGVAAGAGAQAIGGLVSKIPGISDLPGASGLLNGMNGGGTSGTGGSSILSGLGNTGVGQALSSLGGGIGSFLTGNGGMNALGVAQGINAAQLQQKANQYATNAMGDVNASYNERAPLRAQALNVLPSAIAANPFARGGTIKGSNGVAPQSITMANG